MNFKIGDKLTAIDTCLMDEVAFGMGCHALIIGRQYEIEWISEDGKEFTIHSECDNKHYFEFANENYFKELRCNKFNLIIESLIPYVEREDKHYATSTVLKLVNGVTITMPDVLLATIKGEVNE